METESRFNQISNDIIICEMRHSRQKYRLCRFLCMKNNKMGVKMKEISVKAFAKINLSLDVLGKRADGYHCVDMVMQQIDLWDMVTIRVGLGKAPIILEVEQNRHDIKGRDQELPKDGNNLAWKAAELMGNLFGNRETKLVIQKNIPIAAGLGGGSADAAAVLHGLNYLWGLNLSIERMMEIGGSLGSDVPFCVMGQAALNWQLGMMGEKVASCGRATGIGKTVSPLPPLNSWVLLTKPDLSISTGEVYGGLVLENIGGRPDNDGLIAGLGRGDAERVARAMGNVLEGVTAGKHPIITKIKEQMGQNRGVLKVMMSGSGPTVYGLFRREKEGKAGYEKMRELYPETFLVKTL